MDDLFQLTVNYQGKTYTFEAHERNFGYAHKVAVIGGLQVLFEQVEEGK